MRQHGGCCTPNVRPLKTTTNRLCSNCYQPAVWALFGFNKDSSNPKPNTALCHLCAVDLESLIGEHPRKPKPLKWRFCYTREINRWLLETGRLKLSWDPKQPTVAPGAVQGQ